MKGKAIISLAMLLLVAALGVMTGLCTKQRSALLEMEAENAALTRRSAILDELCFLVEDVPLGYATEAFRADKSIIIMKNGETAKLTLTTDWKGDSRVAVDCSGDAAELSFEEAEWETHTALKVKALHPGITVAHFSSDTSYKTFAVWILVE